MESSDYSPPLALTVISGVFLAFGAVFALIIAIDIVMRRGWKSMMWIMIPVYIVNATYLGPLALFVYYKYGRPAKPGDVAAGHGCHHHQPMSTEKQHDPEDQASHSDQEIKKSSGCCSDAKSVDQEDLKSHDDCTPVATSHCKQVETTAENDHGHDHNMSAGRPMWATVLVGICHCGAGCVLGDLVGEWIVYGSGWTINGHGIWAEIILDYIWALAFGILFQYFSIAPMSGDFGPKSVVRAAKADFLSLTSFQIGLFGWMIAYQVGMFDYRLETTTWTYWWLMQVGMFIGSLTAFPMNWWLISNGIKEPCA